MDSFEELERTIRADGPEAAFDLLARRAREERRYGDVFRARSMQARLRLGLPLIEIEPADVAADRREEYEGALRDAAHETGELFLAAGDIAGAWPYFRAIGETAPVAAALDHAAAPENLDAVIEIAFREQVNPRRGFELILEHRGICNAITWFGALPEGEPRGECLKLLVRTLYMELAGALRQHIAKTEGAPPSSESVAELIAGREWLFEGSNYHVDTTHLASVLRFTVDLDDAATMRMAVELADYGTHLAAMYHYRGDPPFDDPYADHGVYLRVLLGEDVERGVEHFRQKAREGAEAGYAFAPEVFVDLLARLERFDDAVAASLEWLPDKALHFCQLAKDYGRLREVARERGDLLAFAAGVMQEKTVLP